MLRRISGTLWNYQLPKTRRRWQAFSRATVLLFSGTLALAVLVPAASASTAHTAEHQALVQCARSAWSGTAPGQCTTNPATATGRAAVISTAGTAAAPAWTGGNGCGGYYTGTGHPWMNCRDTATSTNNYRLAIRTGYWNPAASPPGFGWSKAIDYHNLWMQPIIDTVRLSFSITGGNSDRDYTVYHYNPDGYVDQTVTVVSDNVDLEFDGAPTQDGHPVGVITGYCTPGVGDPIEQLCPDWVDTTL